MTIDYNIRCSKCGHGYPKEVMTSIGGYYFPLGYYCPECRLKMITSTDEKKVKRNKKRKKKIIAMSWLI